MKILIHFRHFPVAMGRWFDWALRDLGHQVFTVGNYNGGKIPWGDNFDYPDHAYPPDLQIPEIEAYPIKDVLDKIEFKPDVILQASDTTYLSGDTNIKNVFLLTDPHAVDTKPRLQFADHVFNMQDYYRESGQTWIPYAYYKPIHKPLNLKTKYDVVFCGLQYGHRVEVLETMKNEGINVFNKLGVIYEEYVEKYNQGKIAFNWSSKMDLPARFFEGLAMKRLVLTNVVPDIEKLGFNDGVHFVGFKDVDDAVKKAKYFLKHREEANEIAKAGWKRVQPHTYKARAKRIIEVIKKL